MSFLNKHQQLRSFSLWLIFLFISIIIFGQSINNFFVSDDFHWLTIARDTSLNLQIFLTNYEGTHQGGSYNPLLVLIFKFFYNLFYTNYFGYHLISIILHASNGFLVYILAKNIFKLVNIKNFKKLAILSGFLFLLYPIHIEAISWIAAWPHLFVTFFYLLSLINYFNFRNTNSWKKLIYSFIFFILALLTKEIAISLPLVILIWEIYFSSLKNKTVSPEDSRRIGIKKYYLLVYFIILALFFCLRYLAIGLIFGTYSSNNFNYLEWTGNLAAFFSDLLSFGFLRTIMYKGIYYYQESVVIIVFVALALYLLTILRKKKYLQFTTLGSLLFVLLPFLPMGLHHTSFAGERYLYLASIFFIIWLIVLLRNIKISIYILLVFLILFLGINTYKLNIWEEASGLSRQIVNSYKNLEIKNKQKLLSVGLPDNLEGAEVFRNNLQQALEIYYPDNYPEILSMQAYLEVTGDNKNNQLLKWWQDGRGWFAESIDGSYVVTGITSITSHDVYYELWNYNYQNYKANTIRLLPNSDMLDKIAKQEVKILIFDKGVLKILE